MQLLLFFHFSSLFGVWDMQQILLRDAIVNILHPTLIAAYSDTVSREPYNILKWPDLWKPDTGAY